jgi:hypothetical protein
MAFGGIYLKVDTGAQEPTTDATPRKVTAFNASMPCYQGFHVDPDNNELRPKRTGEYFLQLCNVSFSGTPSKTFYCGIYVDDQPTGYVLDRKLGAGGDVGASSAGGFFPVKAGQSIHIRHWSDDGGVAFTAHTLQLTAVELKRDES